MSLRSYISANILCKYEKTAWKVTSFITMFISLHLCMIRVKKREYLFCATRWYVTGNFLVALINLFLQIVFCSSPVIPVWTVRQNSRVNGVLHYKGIYATIIIVLFGKTSTINTPPACLPTCLPACKVWWSIKMPLFLVFFVIKSWRTAYGW